MAARFYAQLNGVFAQMHYSRILYIRENEIAHKNTTVNAYNTHWHLSITVRISIIVTHGKKNFSQYVNDWPK